MSIELLANVAQILGVSMQTVDFLNTHFGSKDVQDDVKLLYLLREPTMAWKDVHLQYCGMRAAMGKLYTATHHANGTIKDRVDSEVLKEVLQDPTLYKMIWHLETDLQASIESIEKSFQGESIAKQIELINDLKVRSALRRISKDKGNALAVHKEVCELFRYIQEVIDSPRWDDVIVGKILGARKVYKMDYESMIDYTDKIIMCILDIYEVAFVQMRNN